MFYYSYTFVIFFFFFFNDTATTEIYTLSLHDALPISANPMWPIEEYAISRLKLRWPIAANAPSAIEAMETNTTICCHCAMMPGKAVTVGRTNMAIAATFGAAAKKAVTG